MATPALDILVALHPKNLYTQKPNPCQLLPERVLVLMVDPLRRFASWRGGLTMGRVLYQHVLWAEKLPDGGIAVEKPVRTPSNKHG